MHSSKPAYLVIDTTLTKNSTNFSPTTPPTEVEIYSVAKVAYSKLVTEAAHKDQNLRRLVGHANLYDKLLDEYNNSFSDSESDYDNDSFEDADIEEFTTQAYVTQKSSTNSHGRETVIHEDASYTYQDQHQGGIKFGDVLINENEDAVLCKVPSHSENMNLQHVLGGYAEVEVKELEVFDE